MISHTLLTFLASFLQIDFGFGPANYAQYNYQPRFDWWTIIQEAKGYGDGEGMLCSMTLESGLQDALLRHAAWRTLIPEAHIFVPTPVQENNSAK